MQDVYGNSSDFKNILATFYDRSFRQKTPCFRWIENSGHTVGLIKVYQIKIKSNQNLLCLISVIGSDLELSIFPVSANPDSYNTDLSLTHLSTFLIYDP